MVALVLVLIWVVALVPFALRKRAEWALSSSVDRFRDSTGRLRRIYPHLVAVATERGDAPWVARPPLAGSYRPPSRARLAERRARRRRTLTLLGCATAGTFVLGAIPALRVLWDLSLVALVLGAGYVAALVHFARLEAFAAERARKVVPLQPVGANHRPVEQYAAAGGQVVAMLPVRPAFVLVDRP